MDETRPLSGALRKCLVLGSQTGSAELRRWAERELRGYDNVPAGELPDYRLVHAGLCIDALTPAGGGVLQNNAQPVNRYAIPAACRAVVDEPALIRNGVTELAQLAQQADAVNGSIKIVPHGADELAVLIAQEQRAPINITSVYWNVGPATLHGLLDQVRTRLVQLVTELRASTSADAPALSAARVSQVMRDIRIQGNQNQLSLTIGGQSPDTSGSQQSGRWAPWGLFVAALGSIGTVVAAVAAIIALR